MKLVTIGGSVINIGGLWDGQTHIGEGRSRRISAMKNLISKLVFFIYGVSGCKFCSDTEIDPPPTL